MKDIIWTNLMHLSTNQWGSEKWHAEQGWTSANRDTICCDDAVWRRVTDRLAQIGGNMAVIDVGDAVVCPSHPELAVKGAWSAEKMSAEVSRLRSAGIEAIPKFNFATTHDHWLHEYGRMIGTPQYYAVVRDLIRDVCDIFGHPRLFHLGLDEELMDQIRVFKGIGTFRRGEAWWHDVKFYADCCEKGGSRAWMFSDYITDYTKEFLDKCPRSIVQSSWYYWDKFENEPQGDKRWLMRTHWQAFEQMERGGFDQIPCGTSWIEKNWPPIDNQFAQLVEHSRKVISKNHLLGFMQTSWEYLTPGVGEKKNMESLQHMEAAIKDFNKCSHS